MYQFLLGTLDLPKYKAGLENQGCFDHSLFGIHTRLAEKMDINTCMILEMAFASIFDSGKYNLKLFKDHHVGFYSQINYRT